MNAVRIAHASHYPHMDDDLLDKVVDLFYEKMLDDYTVNRFFSGLPVVEQTQPLKKCLKSIFAGLDDPEQVTHLIDDYFMVAFGKPGMKRSDMASDFDFLMEIAGGKDMRVLTYLSDAHSHLLKLKPDDFHYDVVMKHLTETLTELRVTGDLQNDILAVAEQARDAVLGRQAE
jgi:truncated hemoglobin YjbI